MTNMISVLICTHNKCKFLDLTLSGYTIQSLKEFEIIIVDDGSIDNTKQIVDKYRKLLTLVYVYQERQGIACARNKALELARGKQIIITDDDRIPSPNFVFEHKQMLDTYPKTVVIGREDIIVSFWQPQLQLNFNDGFKFFLEHKEIISDSEKQLIFCDEIQKDFYKTIQKYYVGQSNNSLFLSTIGPHEMMWSRAYGGNISFDSSYCANAIRFDKGYKGYGGEDIDFSFQLYNQNFSFVYLERAINFHQEHKRKKEEYFEMYANFMRFYNKFRCLETSLMKMEWEGTIQPRESADLLQRIKMCDKQLLQEMIEYSLK